MIAPLIFAIAGWSGAILIIAAYGLLTARKLASDGVAYQLLNIAGAVGVGANAWWNSAIPSVALNVIWAGIGMVALWQMRHAGG